MGLNTSKKRMTALTLAMSPLLAQADNARDWQNLPTSFVIHSGHFDLYVLSEGLP